MRRDQRGSIAPAIPIIAMMLLLLGGLTIDGSRQLNARGEAVAYAEEAARAGAQGIDLAAYDLALDPALVRQGVEEYCAEVSGSTGPVTRCALVGIRDVSNTDSRDLVVVVEVETEIKTTLLGMVGLHSLTASAQAKARPYEGIDGVIEPTP